MKILFWNIKKKPHEKEEVIRALLASKKPDVFLMAEGNNEFEIKNVNSNYRQVDMNKSKISNPLKIRYFVHRSLNILEQEYYWDGRLGLCLFRHNGEEIGICGIHFWSQLDGGFNAKYYISEARNELSKLCAKYDKLLVMGDFNLNPWDEYMSTHLGFNAIPWGDTVKTSPPIQKGTFKHYYLYNPIWSYLGDSRTGATFRGTYKIDLEGVMEWHFLDQVVCTKKLVDRLSSGEFEVIKEVDLNKKATDLIDQYSDHYPIFCKLN